MTENVNVNNNGNKTVEITIREDLQRKAVKVTAYGSWLVAMVLTGLRSAEVIPERGTGLLIILLIGAAIHAGMALSRYRLTDTIVRAFEMGYRLQSTQRTIDEVRGEMNKDQGV